ncbi:MAG: FG-GAP repeat protein [Ottowia sp.]|nr:FG-GAP repeat protein [Ottowia sp.]
MGRYVYNPTVDLSKVVLPIEKGGTSGINIPEAVANLELVTNDMIDVAEGIVSLDASGRVPSDKLPDSGGSEVTIEGPLSVPSGYTSTFKITNYDSSASYTVSAQDGTVLVIDDIIEYTAPLTTGMDVITINGRDISLFVVEPKANRPEIISPVSGSQALNREVTITSSAYTNKPEYTHVSTDWELSTDSNFISVNYASIDDTVNLTTWTVEGLSPLATYYARVRHKDNEGYLSNWSKASSFTTKGTYTETNKLLGSDTTNNDAFGWAVDISGDGNTAVVGAKGNSTNKGAVYVFIKDGTNWTEQAKLVANDGTTEEFFGYSVAISDDSNTIVVGAYKEDGTATDMGAAYIFVKTGTNWFQQAKLTDDEILGSDYFGWSVAISGDGNTVVISAPYSDTVALSSGTIYVFDRDGLVWSKTAKLRSLDNKESDYFGIDVDISTDGQTIIVGSHGSELFKGAAYVYKRSNEVWIEQAKLTVLDGLNDDGFGYSVSLSLDGSVAVVGAYGDDTKGSNAGAIYVFTRLGSSWFQQVKLTASDGAVDDWFGNDVSISKDATTIIVGAYIDDNEKGADAGAAYIFTRTVNTWNQTFKIVGKDSGISDQFGVSVASSANGSSFIIGAYGDDNLAGTEAGAAYIFDAVTTFFPTEEVAKLTAGDGAASDFFGYSAALSGDGNTAIIGAYGDDNANGTDEGAAYIFIKDNGTWTQQAKLISLSSLGYSSFGWSVDLSEDGNVAVIGAPDDADVGADAGAAYIFTRTGTTWTQQIKMLPIDLSLSKLGYSVSITADGNTVALGAYGDTTNGASSGAVYVFTYDTGTTSWSQQQKLMASDAAANDQFGTCVKINDSGNTMLVGARYDDSNLGAVYVFAFDGSTWTEQAKLTASDGVAGDQFGVGLALSANGNTAAIGSQYDDTGALDLGSVYVFTRSGITWTQQAKLISSDLTANSYLGYAVDISSNGDILAVGARNVNGNGAVYVFTLVGDNWILRKKLVASDAQADDSFAIAVSLSEDGTELLVGAHMEDPVAGTDAGSAYVFY